MPQPNIVLILTDDQRYDSIPLMPFTQAFFAAGTTFARGYVTTALCCPSRASILTGQYARHHGVLALNDGALNEGQTFATWLQAAGYRTGFHGKYFNKYDGTYVPPGWDDWRVFKGADLYPGGGGYYDYRLRENGAIVHYGNGTAAYSTDVLAQHARNFIAAGGSPFCLVFAPRSPHGNPKPAQRHAGANVDFINSYLSKPNYNEYTADKHPIVAAIPKWDGAKKTAMHEKFQKQARTLLAVDEAVQGIVDAVTTAGQLDNTLFLYTSDNGYFWGEHRLTNKGWPFEEAVRVPMLARFGSGPAQVREEVALNIDLAPTMLDYAGGSMGIPIDGVSLRPIIEGSTPTWRQAFVCEGWGPAANNLPTYQGCRVRGPDYAYNQYASGFREYYDLQADPYELQNVVNDPAYAAEVLAAQVMLATLLAG